MHTHTDAYVHTHMHVCTQLGAHKFNSSWVYEMHGGVHFIECN